MLYRRGLKAVNVVQERLEGCGVTPGLTFYCL